MFLNIDEYFIYLLRLRRYNEIEMLNNVLLMNECAFMKEIDDAFNFDDFIVKLYNTLIKLKFSPSFLNQFEIKKNNNPVINNNILQNNLKKNKINKNLFNTGSQEFNDNLYKTFYDKETKLLVLRIANELIETIKWVKPHELKEVIKEELENETIKKIVKIPDCFIEKYKLLNPNEVNGIENENDYITRILPPKINNPKLPRQLITTMKYILINTISTGEYFGEFTNDSNSFFSHKLLLKIKKSKMSMKLHQYNYFRNMSAITANYDSINNENNNVYLGLIDKGLYLQYIKKFIEKESLNKKKFLLNNSLFKNTSSENLVKTYSSCFILKSLKEGDCLIEEKTELNEKNKFLYFIIKGNFQSYCYQTINDIDKILISLNCQNRIKETLPESYKEVSESYLYEELLRKKIRLNLNYLTENDIVGLSENINSQDKYFNSVYCISKQSLIYIVDYRIIKLLIEGDTQINDNKNLILYNKYKLLCDSLLKQRKIYFESFSNYQLLNSHNDINIGELSKEHMGFNLLSKIDSNEAKLQQILNPNKKIRAKKLKNKICRSLSAVAEVLSKEIGKISFEEKRREKSQLFRRAYVADRKKNAAKSYININVYEDIKINQGKVIFKDLEKYKKGVPPQIKEKSSRSKLGYSSSNSQKNLIDFRDSFLNKDVLNGIKFDSILKYNAEKIKKTLSSKKLLIKNLKKNGIESKKHVNSVDDIRINQNYNKKKSRLNKIGKIKLIRNVIVNQKLRNIYSGDLEKILLNDRHRKNFY